MAYENQQSVCGGNGLVYLRSGNAKPIWQCRLNVKGHKGYIVKSCKTQDLDEAIAFTHELYDDLRLRVKQGLPTDQRTFSEFLVSEWLPYVEKTLSIHRYRLHKGCGTRYFKKYFDNRPLENIQEPTLDNYWEWRRDYWKTGPGIDEKIPGNAVKNPSAKTLKVEQSLLRQMFKYAKRRGYIAALPIIEVVKNKSDPTPQRRPNFDLSEWESLYKYMERWQRGGVHSLHRFQRKMLRNLVCFLINSGLRPNEAYSLKWKHIGFTDTDNIKILVPEDTKTRARTVIPNTTAKRYLEYVWNLSDFHKLEDYVFADKNGKPMRQSHKTFTKLLKEAELLVNTYGKRRTIYSLRHSYITFRLLEGVPVGDIARNAGTSETQIRIHYDHVANEMREKVLTQQNSHNFEDNWGKSARVFAKKAEKQMIVALAPNLDQFDNLTD